MTVALEWSPWPRRWISVVVLVAAGSCVSDADLLPALGLVAGGSVLGAAALLVLRGRSWATIAAGVLPASERPAWRAEVRAVLHATPDGRERRRQVRGFLLGLPACAVTAWHVTWTARR